MSKKKNTFHIAACAAVIVGIVAMWVVVLKGNGSGEDSSGLIVVDDSGSSVTNSQTELVIPGDGTILENVDIYKSHDYPELSDEDFITLEELAENKDKYIDNIMSGSYDNFKFSVRPGFDVPEEIGKYQIICVNKYDENAEEILKYLAGDKYDEKKVTDYRTLDDPVFYPFSIQYIEDDNWEDLVGANATLGNIGQITYYESRDLLNTLFGAEVDNENIKSYILQSEYVDDTYTLKSNDVSVSQYVKLVQDYLDELFTIANCSSEFKQSAIVAEYDSDGNIVYRSVINTLYKAIPICVFYPATSSSQEEFNINVSERPLSAQCASSTSGKTIDYLYLHAQFEDYKTIEEYDKIIAPDKAAKLLSKYLAPDLDGSIIGVELTYYPYYVGNTQSAPLTEGYYSKMETEYTHKEIAPYASPTSYDVFELTPFWTFYFDLDPSVIGLVNCRTGEVSYLHNFKF